MRERDRERERARERDREKERERQRTGNEPSCEAQQWLRERGRTCSLPEVGGARGFRWQSCQQPRQDVGGVAHEARSHPLLLQLTKVPLLL